MVGPPIWDLTSILIRFISCYLLLADIIKIYRQILIDPQTNFSKDFIAELFITLIMDTYELITVTYDTFFIFSDEMLHI